MAELVNHPSHYNQPNRKECIEEMRDKFGDEVVAVFCLTNAYKYLYRAGEKEGNSKGQDIAKAKWYFIYFECNILCDSVVYIKDFGTQFLFHTYNIICCIIFCIIASFTMLKFIPKL